MEPTKEELLAELYKLNKKYERVKQIITKPHYCCFQRVGDEDCAGIYIAEEKYSELNKIFEE